MKRFRNKVTGSVEIITNKMLIEQYEKHIDRYEEIVETTTENTKKTKKQK